MKVRFWGTRGTIARPGPSTVRYGGNTTCIEVRTNSGTLLVLDGGTGVYGLGMALLRELPVNVNLFISHTHWDHIQGLPLFTPIFIPGNTINIHGTFDPVYAKSLRDILAGQMEYCYFPVRESELRANLKYTDLRNLQRTQVGDAVVTPVLMNHPVLAYGYKVEADGASVFFTGDHEPPINIYAPDDEDYSEYEEIMAMKNESIYEHLRDVDLLITDATYTDSEYHNGKVGWGHGTFNTSLDMARSVGAKRLVFTHHDPMRSDDQLDEIIKGVKATLRPDDPPVAMAMEGMEIELGA